MGISENAGHSGEQSDEPRVLLVDGDKRHTHGLARVIRSAVSNLEVRSSFGEIGQDESWDMLIANYDILSESERRRMFELNRLQQKRGRLVVFSAERDRIGLAELFGTVGLTNVLARNGDVDPEELLVTVQKLLRRDIFGLEKYFPWASKTISIAMTGSSDRVKVLDRTRAFACGIGIQPRLVDLFETVADELTTNAIFDAPVDAEGRQRFAHMNRSSPVQLSDGEQISVALSCDGKRLGISVADPFGALSAEKVLDYLSKCFRKGTDQVDTKPGGAGLGLYFTFEALSHFAVNVCPGKRTEMIGLLDIRGTYKDFATRGKSFNIFIAE